ncbi:sugar porter family MFS transporter [Hephaestia sp. GCM10023244]|uniref:sugar porter family MFS transporter n=1 Tax=unclassified Hephaestia TaxID=2631281 RepID=UPI0020773C03|nr:sugar porter family MFS transporter [Hephaestia sp. MAHUQ-44]MCM8730597.1 sugar porter family MFS transporter [Hephaestia sp. MAHUQ-44]
MEKPGADVNRGNVNWNAVIAASLAGLLFGFDTAVISGVTGVLRTEFALSAVGLGTAVSAALVGTLVGALSAGAPGDRFGSRTVLVWIALGYIVSAIGSGASWDLGSFVAFRFLGGLAIGGSSVLAPVYIAEVSPARRRGFLVGLFQLNIVIGILVAYVSNFAIQQLVDGDLVWRLKLGIAAAPAALFLVMLLRIPHSPRWLVEKGRHDDAHRAIAALDMGDPATLIERFRTAHAGQTEGRLRWARHRKPILLAIGIALFNQLSGINAILYYLNDIFAAAGFSRLSADLQAVGIGVANLVATLIGMALIDRVGRKPLLMIGAGGTGLALAGVATIYSTGTGQTLLLPALVGFILFFAISQGAVIWVYLSEIFPTAVRARGQSLGSATHWGMNALLAFGFPIVARLTQAAPFWFFAAAMAVQLVVVWRWFPETRGVDLEKMDRVVR